MSPDQPMTEVPYNPGETVAADLAHDLQGPVAALQHAVDRLQQRIVPSPVCKLEDWDRYYALGLGAPVVTAQDRQRNRHLWLEKVPELAESGALLNRLAHWPREWIEMLAGRSGGEGVADRLRYLEAHTAALECGMAMRAIRTSATQIESLGNQFREDQSRLESTPSVNLESSLQEALVLISTDLDPHEIEFAVNGVEAVAIDRTSLARIWANLWRNAAEAMGGQPGRIRVEVEAEEGWARIQVLDTGPGIPEDLFGEIFDQYVSSHDDPARGRGLAIVRSLIESAGGSISARNLKSGGAAFAFTLPVT